MGQIIVFLTIFLLGFLASQRNSALAAEAGNSAALRHESYLPDGRVEKLKLFLESYGSPLADYAQNFVAAADKNEVDWKLVAAITGVESTFGRQIPYQSYNAYGWCNGDYRFESWEQSIEYVSRYLKEKYYDRGLDKPEKIAPIYAPPSSTWAGKVIYFMKKIECFNDQACLANLGLTL